MIIESPISPDLFKQGMRQLAGGVCVLATNIDGQWHGLTMTAVCSLTMEPPSLIACINRDASAYRVINATRRISVNVLSDHHMAIAAVFSSSDVRGPSRFDAQQWTPWPAASLH